ncbi:hypothetical protein cand_034160 [Cryptosporidium andersoni]|uniref:Uncharacterized protein n=1 Tax=Cryptosporidium andersoni TaxID=117008 RepID=A0A1J4MW43_9CRYT|nr:hypothetical protein cand_034160 [Cryptosporidium andersoni]
MKTIQSSFTYKLSEKICLEQLKLTNSSFNTKYIDIWNYILELENLGDDQTDKSFELLLKSKETTPMEILLTLIQAMKTTIVQREQIDRINSSSGIGRFVPMLHITSKFLDIIPLTSILLSLPEYMKIEENYNNDSILNKCNEVTSEVLSLDITSESYIKYLTRVSPDIITAKDIYQNIPINLTSEEYNKNLSKAIINISQSKLFLNIRECRVFTENLVVRFMLRGNTRFLSSSILNYTAEYNGNLESMTHIFKSLIILMNRELQGKLVLHTIQDVVKNHSSITKNGDIYISCLSIFQIYVIISEYCIIESNTRSLDKYFLKKSIFCINGPLFSIECSLPFLDAILFNITKSMELLRIDNYKEENDILNFTKQSCNNSKERLIFVDFINIILTYTCQQWESQDSLSFSLPLACIIVKLMGITTYLHPINKSLEIFMGNYQMTTNGIHIRLRHIDPIIRCSAMHLGQMYFNILYDLNPKVSNENLTIEKPPKFEELDYLDLDIVSTLDLIKQSLKPVKIRDFSSGKVIINSNGQQIIQKNNIFNYKCKNRNEASESVENFNSSQDDELFWQKYPDLQPLSSAKNDDNTKFPNNTVFGEVQIRNVKQALEFLNKYTKETPQTEFNTDTVDNIIKVLPQVIKSDKSDYNYIIQPLIHKLLSLNISDGNEIDIIAALSTLVESKPNETSTKLIKYSCSLDNAISMDRKIIIINSLQVACENLANSLTGTVKNVHTPINYQNKVTNLFSPLALQWSSILIGEIINLIKVSDSNYDRVPSIYIIALIELYNKILSNLGANNIDKDQINIFGLEICFAFNNTHYMWKDTSVRKCLYNLIIRILLISVNSTDSGLLRNLKKLKLWVEMCKDYENNSDCYTLLDNICSYIHKI